MASVSDEKRERGTGTVRLRSDGRWEGRAPDGKSFYRGTKREATRVLDTYLREKAEGRLGSAPARLTVGQYLTDWLEHSAQLGLRPRVYLGYTSIVGKHLVPAIGHVKLAQLTPTHVQALYSKKHAAGLSPATIRTIHNVLHRALRQAVGWGLLARNPASSELVTRPTVERFEARALTEAEALAFLAAIRGHRSEELLIVFLTTGMREAEIFGLRWQDVDLDAGLVAIRQTADRRTRDWKGKPKTRRSNRPVPLAAITLAALRVQRTKQAELREVAGDDWENHDLVFTTRRGTPIAHNNWTRRDFKPLLVKAELPPEIRPHDLRHSVATLLMGAGVPLPIVSKLLGHARPSTTADLYTHVDATMVRGATDLLGALLEGKTRPRPTDRLTTELTQILTTDG